LPHSVKKSLQTPENDEVGEDVDVDEDEDEPPESKGSKSKHALPARSSRSVKKLSTDLVASYAGSHQDSPPLQKQK
jgi:hypothetical protein